MQGTWEQSEKTGMLHLSFRHLSFIPSPIFQLTKLFRLDLGHNDLTCIPKGIGSLTSLTILWANDNPLTSISSAISNCVRLKELDLAGTHLVKLPVEMGRLKHLKELNVENVPLKKEIATAEEGILPYLRKRDVRKMLKVKLFETLRDGPYREVASSGDGEALIYKIVKLTLVEFSINDDIRSVIRNADRLFPTDINLMDVSTIRKKFIQIRRDNDMKKCGAELELKIRNIYFDAIDPQKVEGMVKSIYEKVHDFDDFQFLVKHAVELFPKKASQVNGATLFASLIALRQKLAEERAAAISSLFKAVSSLYSDSEPHLISNLVDSVAALFKKAKDLKSLASDTGVHFPHERLNAVPAKVKASFLKSRNKMMGGEPV